MIKKVLIAYALAGVAVDVWQIMKEPAGRWPTLGEHAFAIGAWPVILFIRANGGIQK